MTIIVRRDAADPKKWAVIEDDGNGTVTIGGPFETRAYARQVAEGAQIMADRLAAKRTGAVSLLREARGWVDGHSETGWGAAQLVAKIDAAIAAHEGR